MLPGVGYLAAITSTPILPIAIYRVKRKTYVNIGEQIPKEFIKKHANNTATIVDAVMKKLMELLSCDFKY